ncbi:MAG: putative threonylcarbamoyl-AMP synthase [Acidimicrobiales bacterium]|nr:MAG: threonylcarbamoyl-AMP synthase [Actinomycetota bacterium]MBV6508884.1 putative threonylcarbamoyl-AMP synthase [Acidimicrobiales bacterium]RIK05010.1 MAG: threonylcarbamoyl-AMP synthase [Acidobacteriota bacterium]
MRVVSLSDFGHALDAAVDVLASGGVVVIPTDTVYGLVARLHDQDAIDKVFELKRRADRRPMAVLVGSMKQALALCEADDRCMRVMRSFWPGPLTLVLPRSPSLDADLGGSGDSVGVRWPRSRFVTELATRVGPIVASSANLSGTETPTGAGGVIEMLQGRLDLVVDGGELGRRASTVADVSTGELVVLREGPVLSEDLRRAW